MRAITLRHPLHDAGFGSLLFRLPPMHDRGAVLESATEASIAQLIAVLNHAAKADPPRSDQRPAYRPLPPKSGPADAPEPAHG